MRRISVVSVVAAAAGIMTFGVPAAVASDAGNLKWQCSPGYFCVYSSPSGNGRVESYRVDQGGKKRLSDEFRHDVQSYYFLGPASHDGCLWEHGNILTRVHPGSKNESIRASVDEIGACP